MIRFLSWLSAIFWTGLGTVFLLRMERLAEGLSHVYEPSSGQAIPTNSTPVKNIVGKVIGYKEAHGRVTTFPKQ